MFGSNTSAVSADVVFVEDVFSTTLYTGTGSYRAVDVGIPDLAVKGALFWAKGRNTGTFTENHKLYDTARGGGGGGGTITCNPFLSTNSASSITSGSSVTFNPTGTAVILNGGEPNETDINYVSWTFRKQPKFFDVVTYTGTGSNPRSIDHSLGSVPGFIVIKNTGSTSNWYVLHRGGGSWVQGLCLNDTRAGSSGVGSGFGTPTSTQFVVSNADTNGSGQTYVAYLFAHNAGGFGLTGTDNVITCGSYTGTGAAGNTITLGYEPQWVLIKRTDAASSWNLADIMRGMPADGYNNRVLYPNLSSAENNLTGIGPTATGFTITSTDSDYNGGGASYIYIAIRRGPMKVPTDGTKVFEPLTYTATSSSSTITNSGFVVDANLGTVRNTAGYYRLLGTRLTNKVMATDDTNAESAFSQVISFALQNGVVWNGVGSTQNAISYQFRRALGFFDVVCYTSNTGSYFDVPHSLKVTPEFIIGKSRNNADTNWHTWHPSYPNSSWSLYLNSSNALTQDFAGAISSVTPTVVQVVNGLSQVNNSCVLYLFATCPGVSKVGSYTGTGTTQQINCGFTAGARFVLIKRTDSTGDWYVWDSARGIVAGNDPYLLLNSTAAEVTSTDYIDAYSAGFEISSTAPAAINANGGTFIYLAIA